MIDSAQDCESPDSVQPRLLRHALRSARQLVSEADQQLAVLTRDSVVQAGQADEQAGQVPALQVRMLSRRAG